MWLDTRFYVLFCFFFQLSLPDGGPRSAGWREHGERRRKFDFDLRGDRGGCGEEDGRVGGGSSHLRRCRGLDGFEDDKDGLPEWCLDDEDEEMGTFDASGAFLPLKVPSQGPGGVDGSCLPAALPLSTVPFLTQKGPKEPIPEEQELDFQGLEEEEEEPSEGVDEEGPEAGEPLQPCREAELSSKLRCLCAYAYIHVPSQESNVWRGTSVRCEQNDLWSPLEALEPAGTHTALTLVGPN